MSDKRIPPHSLEAEQSVIAAIIMDNEIMDDVVLMIDENDFYYPDLKMIYYAMKKLKKLDSAIDLVTLKNVLGDDFEKIGGQEHLFKITMSLATSAYYKDHCKIIKSKSFLRRVLIHSQELAKSAYEQDEDTILKLLSDVPNRGSIDNRKHKTTLELLQDTKDDVFKRMQSETTDLRGLPTGITALDRSTGGMKPGEIIGVKAGPNVGKSVFCVNICQHLAKKGIKTAYFAYEMVDSQFGYRLATSEMKVPIDALVNPKEGLNGNAKYLRRIKDYNDEQINNLHIFPADQLPLKTVAEIEGKLRVYDDVKLIVVDYLQLMRHTSVSGFDAYTENLRELKSIATRYYIPVIVVLGQSRSGEIRGTNEIDHDLDQLYEIVREKYGETKEIREKAEIRNKKGRDGKICKVDTKYFEDYIIFKEIENANTN